MQAWNQVKVTAAGDYLGRAGVVVRSKDGVNTVKLDATPDKAEETVNFSDAELQLLGN